MALTQIQSLHEVGWHKRRARQLLHSIPHFISEIRGIRSVQEGIDWLYFKNPYLFKLRKFPPRATVEFTNQCNFACGYCPRSIMSRTVGHMDPQFFVKLVEELEAGGCSGLKIGGLGEPALHPEFARMMEAVHGSRMNVYLYTNGTALTKVSPEQLCQWNIHTIVLSIDGLDASSFERQRKNGNYPEIREAAKRFAGYKGGRKPILEIRHVIVPNERPADLRAFKKDWLQIGDTVKFNYLIPLRPMGASVPADVRCRDIRREIYIRWDSRLLVCAGQEAQRLQQGPEFLGDATKNAIADLWFDARLQDLRSAHNNLRSQPPTLCQHCAFR